MEQQATNRQTVHWSLKFKRLDYPGSCAACNDINKKMKWTIIVRIDPTPVCVFQVRYALNKSDHFSLYLHYSQPASRVQRFVTPNTMDT